MFFARIRNGNERVIDQGIYGGYYEEYYVVCNGLEIMLKVKNIC